ncbi:hypothetical protein [Dictyobacter arantiisoli]|uniref:DUF4760 domain-containing protein n=1 Tax=Dictyobacter arantiisoli TaxID=2014874 RepID=A0A5A5TJ04_9CHLR|nr:hypothetical protein [Dictyobacter arantiisoli]GCF11590.1 hypothetical protein KDI_51540 [Dictyobacter arantiisoli]
MSLSDLASIAIIVQGVFFIISIFLVWYQLRENTNLTRAANTQKLVEIATPFNFQLAQSRDLTKLWQQGPQHFNDMDEIDRERYFSLLTWWLMLHENIYHQWRKKLVEQDTYLSWTQDLEYFIQRQRIHQHWTTLQVFFEDSFAEHVMIIIERQTKETSIATTNMPECV